ncbi:Asp23/Gls24 family envelope stress response protein [Erysipelotrichaceae bacterium OH741_COT-311]|nr:Asp23/Gls24 family envelope stress response protein [Erysipelotrichaceae bacterium OH741_COT-311]
MAQEYILLNKKDEKSIVALSKGVFEAITKISIDEFDGVYLVDRKQAKSIHCKIKDNKLALVIDVKFKYGVNVNRVSTRLQSKVHEAILNMTGLNCHVVNIRINGFVFDHLK